MQAAVLESSRRQTGQRGLQTPRALAESSAPHQSLHARNRRSTQWPGALRCASAENSMAQALGLGAEELEETGGAPVEHESVRSRTTGAGMGCGGGTLGGSDGGPTVRSFQSLSSFNMSKGSSFTPHGHTGGGLSFLRMSQRAQMAPSRQWESLCKYRALQRNSAMWGAY